MKIISKNLELCYISHDARANGETDFKGETSMLTTEQRIDFLNEYAHKLPEMFEDFSLDKPIVTIEEAKQAITEGIPGEIIIDGKGRKSQRFVGDKCIVTFNPDTQELIQTNRKR